MSDKNTAPTTDDVLQSMDKSVFENETNDSGAVVVMEKHTTTLFDFSCATKAGIEIMMTPAAQEMFKSVNKIVNSMGQFDGSIIVHEMAKKHLQNSLPKFAAEIKASRETIENDPNSPQAQDGLKALKGVEQNITFAGENLKAAEALEDESFDALGNTLFTQCKNIVAQIPALADQTLAVDLLPKLIGEDGVDLNKLKDRKAPWGDLMQEKMLSVIKKNPDLFPMPAKTIDAVKQMTNEDALAKMQEMLKEKGMDDLAERIADGNLSREDLIHGMAEYGHTMKAADQEINQELLKKIQDAMPEETDNYLLEGLVLAEQYLDKQATESATEMSAKLETGYTKLFDESALGQTMKTSLHGAMREAIISAETQKDPSLMN